MTTHYDYSERLEGMDEIRKAIYPTMSKSTFYLRHRKNIEYLLMERVDHWRRRPRVCKYFTFREFIYHYLIDKRLL